MAEALIATNSATESLFGGGARGIAPSKSAAASEATPKENSRMPLAIRRLAPLLATSLLLAQQPLTIEKNVESLPTSLGGEEYFPGLYYDGGTLSTQNAVLLPDKKKTYYMINASADSFTLRETGEHGAKLSVLFNEEASEDYSVQEEDHYKNIPPFVCLSNEDDGEPEKEYTYIGQYTQFRWSDKFDHDRIVELIPVETKNYGARLLSKKYRASWTDKTLMETLWPKPAFNGAFSEGVSGTTETTLTSGTDYNGEEEVERGD